MRTAIVYLATNRVNGKRYVGATSKRLPTRRRQHHSSANAARTTCRFFHAAIRKYGEEAFEWAVLLECGSFEEALREEIRLITEIKPEYNLTIGGQGTKGRVVSQEQRERHSRAMKGRKQTPEHREKIRQAQTGLKRSPEQRERMGAARRGKPLSEEHRRNMGLARRGKKWSPEIIEKRVAPRRGKALSPEHRANVSSAITKVWAARRQAAETAP